MAATAQDVIGFWRAAGPRKWFAKDDAFDAAIRLKFEPVHHAAAKGKYDAWAEQEGLSAEEAQRLDNRLVGVVAHDRATLGGMLLASGTVSLLLVLWCFRRGANWLGRAMMVLGLPAYAAALGVHFWVGYTDWRHLVPAWAGCALWAAGGWLSRGYLAARL